MFSIPLGSVIDDVQTTGSAAVDLLGSLSIFLYDLIGGDVGSSDLDWSDLTGSLFN
ncbi:hypothetical protein [Dietzia lutea]|uniref:hypothetical protein n=1 Tax=Dietzia lutea TaxID=546160 RepID=UPI00142D1DAE|nr:hypothetical protein [Dietzia lutea]